MSSHLPWTVASENFDDESKYRAEHEHDRFSNDMGCRRENSLCTLPLAVEGQWLTAEKGGNDVRDLTHQCKRACKKLYFPTTKWK